MKIGILTFYSALNFGANLQACSTYCYLKSHGYEPVFINYSPVGLSWEEKKCTTEQVTVQRQFQRQFQATEPCHNAKDVANVMKKNEIQNIIIGSDAVAQHHPFLSRIVFPSRHFISIAHPASDKLFPNPFWGEFLDYSEQEISVSLMSVSSQQSEYKRFSSIEMKAMMKYISQFRYISVRDNWTQNMYEKITRGRILPEVTPDPVFAFNENVSIIPTKDEIVRKFDLPEKYILLALRIGRSVTPTWVKTFEKICEKNGYACIGLPFPYGFTPLNVTERKINLPLSPLDWYALIKYANGYVGHNMHSIVSALHNSVPCFSMDQYGTRILSQFVKKRSSKIFDILSAAGFPEYWSPSNLIIDLTPSPKKIFSLLMSFNQEKCKVFAEDYYQKYLKMMKTIESKFI